MERDCVVGTLIDHLLEWLKRHHPQPQDTPPEPDEPEPPEPDMADENWL